MKKIFIASNSNGKDSLYMILELIRRKYPLDTVLFFDGGKEFQAIHEAWERVKIILDENNINWDVIKPPYEFDYLFNEKPICTRDGSEKYGYSWCGGNCRWMTKYKTKAIHDYYKTNYGKDCMIIEYIGIASDEQQRVKIPDTKSNTIQKYPLIEWGYTENDCFVGCYKQGFRWIEPKCNSNNTKKEETNCDSSKPG